MNNVDIGEYNTLVNKYNEIYKENKQLKECYCNRTDCSGRIKDSKEYDSVVQQMGLYKSVIDEVYEELDYMSTDKYTTDYDIKDDYWKKLKKILEKVKGDNY